MARRSKMENMELTGKKVLVTGGAGFIGSHVVDDLILAKNRVIVVDNLSSGKKSNINPAAVFYKADICDAKKLAAIFQKEKPTVILHFAAKPLVDEAYKNPSLAIETNVMGTVNVLELCRQNKKIESVVVVSSDKAYGKSEKLPYNEHSPLQGDHPYDASKSAADLIAKTYATTYGLPVVITRFSNVFGPRDYNFSRIVPGAIEAVIKNKTLLIRSDGKMVREYTYVKDISRGCLVLAAKAADYPGQAFNFGSKNIFNVVEAVNSIEKSLEKKIDYQILNIAKNEIPKQYLDWSKAKKVLVWKPIVNFKNGIQETFDWYKRYFKIS